MTARAGVATVSRPQAAKELPNVFTFALDAVPWAHRCRHNVSPLPVSSCRRGSCRASRCAAGRLYGVAERLRSRRRAVDGYLRGLALRHLGCRDHWPRGEPADAHSTLGRDPLADRAESQSADFRRPSDHREILTALLTSPVGPELSAPRPVPSTGMRCGGTRTARSAPLTRRGCANTRSGVRTRTTALSTPWGASGRQMSDDRFLALSQFLRHPACKAANNGAERNRPWYTLAEISWPRCRPPRHRSARGLPSPQAGSPRSRRRPQTANVSVPRCTSPNGLANRQQFAGW